MSKNQKIDLDKIVAERLPGRKIPKFVMWLLKKITRQSALNDLYDSAPDARNMDFINAAMRYFNVQCKVVGLENLPSDRGPLIFASNHPLGGMEAVCIAYILGNQYDGRIKIYANELLTLLDPLKEMFLPIYKYGSQNRDNIQNIQNFYNSDNHLITFPAGATSRKYGKKIIDLEWQKHFVKTAVEHQRDIVPLYFQARNSWLFYALEKFREKIGSKVNFEMLLLVNEIFNKKGKTFTLFVGAPIRWQTFDKQKTQKEWAAEIKKIVYQLPEILDKTEMTGN